MFWKQNTLKLLVHSQLGNLKLAKLINFVLRNNMVSMVIISDESENTILFDDIEKVAVVDNTMQIDYVQLYTQADIFIETIPTISYQMLFVNTMNLPIIHLGTSVFIFNIDPKDQY
ncbi:putative orfan [Tupanvirus soda lake]|uniref:Orfan n=2 Tax=Tupanvirus TaxID=2094720 RepID=A0AC62ABS4_9VIRU|nr:putative orfan [Tupanvirus soda lake]QKU35222.1 putative orfan [Tupanvirus soda lake]